MNNNDLFASNINYMRDKIRPHGKAVEKIKAVIIVRAEII